MVITQNDLSMLKVHSKKAKDIKGGHDLCRHNPKCDGTNDEKPKDL
jgi:hypothetical protein